MELEISLPRSGEPTSKKMSDQVHTSRMADLKLMRGWSITPAKDRTRKASATTRAHSKGEKPALSRATQISDHLRMDTMVVVSARRTMKSMCLTHKTRTSEYRIAQAINKMVSRIITTGIADLMSGMNKENLTTHMLNIMILNTSANLTNLARTSQLRSRSMDKDLISLKTSMRNANPTSRMARGCPPGQKLKATDPPNLAQSSQINGTNTGKAPMDIEIITRKAGSLSRMTRRNLTGQTINLTIHTVRANRTSLESRFSNRPRDKMNTKLGLATMSASLTGPNRRGLSLDQVAGAGQDPTWATMTSSPRTTTAMRAHLLVTCPAKKDNTSPIIRIPTCRAKTTGWMSNAVNSIITTPITTTTTTVILVSHRSKETPTYRSRQATIRPSMKRPTIPSIKAPTTSAEMTMKASRAIKLTTTIHTPVSRPSLSTKIIPTHLSIRPTIGPMKNGYTPPSTKIRAAGAKTRDVTRGAMKVITETRTIVLATIIHPPSLSTKTIPRHRTVRSTTAAGKMAKRSQPTVVKTRLIGSPFARTKMVVGKTIVFREHRVMRRCHCFSIFNENVFERIID